MHDATFDIELKLLLEAIYLRYHYDFRQYAPASLKRRLAEIMRRFDCRSLSGPQERLLHEADVFRELLSFLTITVSEMFRDPSYYRTLRERVVPFLQTYPSLRVWAAGCSTGEEVYSLAILLREEGLLECTLIYATDIGERRRRARSSGHRKGQRARPHPGPGRRLESCNAQCRHRRVQTRPGVAGRGYAQALAQACRSRHGGRTGNSMLVKPKILLVDDLLDVYRINSGRVELKTEPLAVQDFVQPALESSRPLIDARRQDFPVALPPEPLWVEGDRVRLAQVVANLLNNASKYTTEGGHIGLTVEPSPDEVCIRVCDTGCGIEPSALASLFDLFYQADRTLDRSQGGLGIGLSLVRSLMAMHGGSVRAFSAGRGKGSEFVIRCRGWSGRKRRLLAPRHFRRPCAESFVSWWWTTTAMPPKASPCC